MGELAKILTTRDPSHAEIAKNWLRSAGIDAHIEGEGQAGFTGVLEMQIVVPAAEAEQARELLRAMKDESAE